MNTQDMLCVMLTLNKKHFGTVFPPVFCFGSITSQKCFIGKGLYDQELEKATYIL